MADIAQTLKREPNHLGALMGMAAILEARGKKEDALKVYERALAIAPHWRTPRRPPTSSRPRWPAASFNRSGGALKPAGGRAIQSLRLSVTRVGAHASTRLCMALAGRLALDA